MDNGGVSTDLNDCWIIPKAYPWEQFSPMGLGGRLSLSLLMFLTKKGYVSGWRVMVTQLFCFCSLNKFSQVAGTKWHSAGPRRYTHSLSSSLTTRRIFNSSDPSSQISPQPWDPVSSSSPCSVQIPQENRQVTAIMFYNYLKARKFSPLR